MSDEFVRRKLSPRGVTGGAAAQAVSALNWLGNVNHPSASPSSILYWPTPLAAYPATYIMRVFPRAQSGYWSGLFWADLDFDTFDQFDFLTTAYYGMHPYPNPPQTGTPRWEISANGADHLDNPSGADVVFGSWPPTAPTGTGWYHHVVRTSPTGSVQRFHVNWPNATPRIDYDDTDRPEPSNRAIIIGDAPWRRGLELYSGLMRGLQFYDAELSDADVNAEIASPGSVRTPWYLNLNPTPSDVQDKSGNGHHPVWVDANRPGLWQAA